MFIYLAALFVGFFLFAYLIKVFRSFFYGLAENSLALVNILLMKIDEDEKVKLVQRKNNQLLLSLAKVFVSVLVALCAGSVPLVLFLWVTGQHFDDLDFSSIYAIISLSAGSTLGFIVPVKKKGITNYSELSQLLHRMALNNYAIAFKLFKLEAKKLPKKGVAERDQFVIVSGLARAGTTSLMNKLALSGSFASLSYANMPFLTAPNFWRKIYNPKKGKQKERSHKDGIMIGQDSIEALEEYFFKVITNDSFVKEGALEVHWLSETQYSDYLKYQGVVRNSDQKIYLAKNNNFILRYASVREFNKSFLAIFMFRDPLTHAASLLEKHREFSDMQKEDGFALEYMDWLGHHEFGLNQKVFQFTEAAMNYPADKGSLDYWLQVWINYYTYLLSVDRTSAVFVDYTYYCEQPTALLRQIFEKIGIAVDLPEATPYSKKREVTYEYSEALKLKADQIYDGLKALARQTAA